jgi:hypothetical protein
MVGVGCQQWIHPKMRCPHLERVFENLGEHGYDHDDVSPPIPKYNCIAWAAGDDQQRWWPADWDEVTYYWPPHLPRHPFGQEKLENFIAAFEWLGYVTCTSPRFEHGVEKIAIFIDPQGRPLHAARQLDSGDWTSKCGIKGEDIKHRTLFAIEGKEYGKASAFLKKRRDGHPFFEDRTKENL